MVCGMSMARRSRNEQEYREQRGYQTDKPISGANIFPVYIVVMMMMKVPCCSRPRANGFILLLYKGLVG